VGIHGNAMLDSFLTLESALDFERSLQKQIETPWSSMKDADSR